jgi:hypothetical protein
MLPRMRVGLGKMGWAWRLSLNGFLLKCRNETDGELIQGAELKT